MRRYLEIRVPADDFGPQFEGDAARAVGRPPGVVWIVTIPADRPRFEELGRQYRQYQEERGKALFLGWRFIGQYSPAELRAAGVFYLHINAAFEPTGDECGTVYDYSTACPTCGAGHTQISDLILDMRRIPKSKDIARTIYNEYVVSQRLAELLADHGITGYELGAVRHKARREDDPMILQKLESGRRLIALAEDNGLEVGSLDFVVWANRPEQLPLLLEAEQEHSRRWDELNRARPWKHPVWYQLNITGSPLRMVPPTHCAIDPFTEDLKGEYRHACGHTAGLNIVTELSVARSDWDGSDFAVTYEYVGKWMLLRQLILISPRLFRLLRDHKIKGWQFEVAYLV